MDILDCDVDAERIDAPLNIVTSLQTLLFVAKVEYSSCIGGGGEPLVAG